MSGRTFPRWIVLRSVWRCTAGEHPHSPNSKAKHVHWSFKNICRYLEDVADLAHDARGLVVAKLKEFDTMAMITRVLAYAILTALLAAPARAEEVKVGDLVITQAWSRATPGGAKVASGYLTIENRGSAPDRLIGSFGDVADKVELHEMTMDHGVMTMRPLDKGLTVEPGKTVKLAPGGYHLMLVDIRKPLKRGDKVPVTLEFEKAGKVTVSLNVEEVGAKGPAGGGNAAGQMDMQKMPSGMKM